MLSSILKPAQALLNDSDPECVFAHAAHVFTRRLNRCSGGADVGISRNLRTGEASKNQAEGAGRISALSYRDDFLLTVVTINRNNAMNLPRTLHSLRHLRNDPQVECLFIDGASTDQSLEIAKAFYAPENLVSEPDTGIYSAMNKGLFKARGKYVLWINSGDELLPSADCGSLKAELMDSASDLVACGLIVVDSETNRILKRVVPKKTDVPRWTFPHPSTFFLRRTALRHGGYKEYYKIAGDRELILRIVLSGGSISFNPFFLAKFYNDGISSQRSAYMEDLMADYENGLISYTSYVVKALRFTAGKYRIHGTTFLRKML